jgi:hypothetical protein
MAEMVLSGQSLGQIRDAIPKLGKISESQDSKLLELVCFMFLGHQFQIVKKNLVTMQMQVNYKTLLTQIEDAIIEYVCSDDFERRMNYTTTISDLMRATEYKIQAYFDISSRMLDQPATADVSQAQQDGNEEQQIVEQKEESTTV